MQGDLGAIDETYDVAISTTCYALDNIVVDSIGTAQLCIQLLKKENLGIATFIALDKQQHFSSRIHNKPSTYANKRIYYVVIRWVKFRPEGALRLFDLVRVEDEKVLPAFYYALNDTLVANDINDATRIANSGRRWRVVTLKGEVVETSGAMTGGGNSQKRCDSLSFPPWYSRSSILAGDESGKQSG